MSTDEFYDSLDEASSSEESLLCTSVTLDSPSQLENSSPKADHPKLDISLSIPLYSGEAIKTQGFRKSRSYAHLQKDEKQCLNVTKSGSFGRSCSKPRKEILEKPLTEKRRKSYLSLFHKRIGYPADDFLKKGQETTRGVCGDATFRSDLSSLSDYAVNFQDATDNIDSDDSESFYLKYIEGEEEKNELRSNCTASPHFKSPTSCSLTLTEISELRSVSENCLNSSASSARTNKIKKITKPTFKIPALGGLGPDIENCKDKLYLLRKKQNYGQQVSDRNRIKSQEVKLLKNLKKEIETASSLIDDR